MRVKRIASTATVVGLALALELAAGCRRKVTPAQCEALVARYAELVIKDKMPGASPEVVREAQARVRTEAAGDENFRNCTTEVEPHEFDCAMAAKTPDAIEKCLE